MASKARKHVIQALQECPEIPSEEEIGKCVRAAGGNLFELQDGNGDLLLALLPTRFNKLLWLRRGHFCVFKRAEGETADLPMDGDSVNSREVKGLISSVLVGDQVTMSQQNQPEKWSTLFVDEHVSDEEMDAQDYMEDGNPNRPRMLVADEDDEADSSDPY
ncbi:translation initiation factor 1A [Kipferlia bialata]|uniref:Translation initiation factor 1A n=1 Tax=Kipferlia bialata TaxID=797122 RepID=A0A9K3CVT0_9EUKA|nr:translation initiation factor 1A [Kipferlia bialata]|eukprot:g5282.t1